MSDYRRMTTREIVRELLSLSAKGEELAKAIDECYAELDRRDQIQNPREIRMTVAPRSVDFMSRVNPRLVRVYLRGGTTPHHTTSVVSYYDDLRVKIGSVEVLYDDEKKAERLSVFVDDPRFLEITSPASYWVTSYKNGFVEVELDQHAYAKAVGE